MIRSAFFSVVAFVLTTGRAFAQSVVPSPAVTPAVQKPAPPWTFYMAILTIAIAALTVIMVVVGYLVQAPGFRRKQGPASPAPGQTP